MKLDNGRKAYAWATRAGRSPAIAAAIVGLAAFLVYLRTLAPSIVWGDSAELVATAYQAGVPHPTGYPLYMMVGYLFSRLGSPGSVAYRMNLLSAILAAVTVAFVYLLARRVTRSRMAGAIVALLFAFSVEFWSQAVIAEVYTLHMLFAASALGCLVLWDRKGDRRWLLASAVVYGLSFTHHLTSALLAPGLVLFALTSRYRSQLVREFRWTAPLFLAPLLLYAYLPLAAMRDTALNWGDVRSWDNFWFHITGRIYSGRMFQSTPSLLWTRLVAYAGLPSPTNAGYLMSQFSLSLLWLAPLGAWSLFRRRRRLFGLTALVYLAVVAHALNYNISDIEVYYLPAHMIVAVWIGCGLGHLAFWFARVWRRLAMARRPRRRIKRAFASAWLLLPLLLLSTNWIANDRHRDRGALIWGRAALEPLKPGAVLIGSDWTVFPLLYVQYVENQRRDVAIVSLPTLQRPDVPPLTPRPASQGLVLPGLPRHHHDGGHEEHEIGLVRQFVADTLNSRPVYLTGAAVYHLDEPRSRAMFPAYVWVGGRRAPLVELIRPGEAVRPGRQPQGEPGRRADLSEPVSYSTHGGPPPRR